MYDSVTARDIPANAQMVAGYVDGLYRWSQADWDRFPQAVKVRIAVLASTDDGHVLDVETGDATPTEYPAWAKRRIAAGTYPTVYCNRSNLGAVLDAVDGAGLHGITGIWLADWTDVPHLVAGTSATQYDHPPHSGGHYDLSLVADHWPGVDPPPPLPRPGPGPGPEPGTSEGPLPAWLNGIVDWILRLLRLRS